MSAYRELNPRSHTMRVSGSISKSVTFNMFDATAAAMFLATFQGMTSDPHDELWKMSGGGAAGDEEKQRGRQRSKQRGERQDKGRNSEESLKRKNRIKVFVVLLLKFLFT